MPDILQRDGLTIEMLSMLSYKSELGIHPLITRTLYDSKDMESFATGLKRIVTACQEAQAK